MRIEDLIQVSHAESGILKRDARRSMARVIEYYIPTNFRKSVRWIPQEQRGKIIEFVLPEKKTA